MNKSTLLTIVFVTLLRSPAIMPSGACAEPTSLRITEDRVPEAPDIISHTELQGWKKTDYVDKRNKVLIYADGKTFGQQELLGLESFSTAEVKLIRRIKALAVRQKLNRRDLNHYAEELQKVSAHFVEAARSAGIVPSDADIQEYAQAVVHHVDPTRREVEIGAWRLVLKGGGDAVAIMTSKSDVMIDTEGLLRAINGLLNSRSISLDQISAIQFFHNHPATIGITCLPLSAGDQAVMRNMKGSNRLKVPLHFYAIGELDGELFTYHMGL